MTEAISLLDALKLQSSSIMFATILGPQIGESPTKGHTALLWWFDVKLPRKKSLISVLTPKCPASLAPISELAPQSTLVLRLDAVHFTTEKAYCV